MRRALRLAMLARTSSILLLVASSLVLLSGCVTDVIDSEETTENNTNDDPNVNPDPNPNPNSCAAGWDGSFEVGAGEDCFSSLDDGQNVALMAGPQGGFHIWVSVRCRDCARDQLLRYGVQNVETGEWAWGEPQEHLVTMDKLDSYKQAAGLTAFMPGDSWSGEAPDVLGKRFLIVAEVAAGGEVYTDEVIVVPDRVEYWDGPPCEESYGEGCLG